MSGLVAALQFLMKMMGVPPVSHEAALRAWMRRLARRLQGIASYIQLTKDPNDVEWDDRLANGLAGAIENEFFWAFFFALLNRLSPDDEVVIGADEPAIVQVATTAGISPLDIIAIIKAILDILKMFRR